MATPDEHRRTLQALTDRATRDLAALFAAYDDPDGLRDALLEALPGLVGLYGSAAASVAAGFYDDLRDEAGFEDLFVAEPAELPDDERAEILARWGLSALYENNDPDAALTATSGGLQRIITDASRATITAATVRDPRSDGWGWVRSGEGGCDYCRSLAGAHTGPEFRSHDRCRCIAVPRFA